ncbi:flagellar biosynthesis [bacterium BFN5]|nr:flagellar biosynthesis [bacterium BFN5]QJW45380.1 flagellar biosynthesis [bacterium BFN5]
MSEENKHEKRQQAIALTYDIAKNAAPKVVAKGTGHLAEQILAAAHKNAVPVYQNKTLTGMLMAIDLDREIPPELYRVVAEVLAYVYRIDQRLGNRLK